MVICLYVDEVIGKVFSVGQRYILARNICYKPGYTYRILDREMICCRSGGWDILARNIVIVGLVIGKGIICCRPGYR